MTAVWEREDWRHLTGPVEPGDDIKIRPGIDGESLIVVLSGQNPQRIAAACLYDQPFGFTWEDVDDERTEVLHLHKYRDALDSRRKMEHPWLDALVARKENRIARIEALLPPRELVIAANQPGTPIDY